MVKITKKLVFLDVAPPAQVQDNTFWGDQYYLEHSHEYYECFVILEGEMRHNLNGKVEILPSGTVCLLRPDDTHSVCSAHRDQELHLVNIVFIKEVFSQIVLSLSHEFSTNYLKDDYFTPLTLSGPERIILESKVELLKGHETGQKLSPVKIAMVKSLLIDVLISLHKRNLSEQHSAPEWLQMLRKKIRECNNFTRDLKYQVELSGKTQEHLTRAMKRFYNETPQAFLIRLRVNEAARLLRNSKLSLEDIMSKTAFQNMSYFRRCFKEYYGMPPRRYQRRSKQLYMPKH